MFPMTAWSAGRGRRVTFLYPAALQVRKIPTGGDTRPRTAYVIRNGRLTQGWDEVARSTPAIAPRAVATLTTYSGVGDRYRIYALAGRDGVRLQLAYIRPSSIAGTW
jgi:hypothetical protein